MKRFLISLLLAAGVAFGQGSKTPINNGILQSDLDFANFKAVRANLSDYAGSNMIWNTTTKKFDATAGGGGIPGGSNTQFQYNNGGAFGGLPSVTYDGTIPLTISSTGQNTTTTGILFQNTTITLLDGNSRSPSLIFKQHYYSGGDHVIESKLEAKDQALVFQNRTDGGVWEPGFSLSSSPAGGALFEYGGDIQIVAAVLRGLDDVTTGGDGGHPTRIGMFNYSTTARPGISMTSDAFVGWAIPSSATYQSWEAQNDTLIERAAAGEVGIYSAGTTLGTLRVATQPPGDNSTKAATTEFVTAAVGAGGGGAPTTATYITQTPAAGLSAETALSTLATGLLKSTTTTGALTTITDNSTNWNTAFSQTRQWDGGSTGLVAATGRTSLGLVIGTNVQAWDTDLDVWATKTPYAGTLTITTAKTLNVTNALTLSGTDLAVLNIGGGGTLGTAAYTASSAYEVPLTFSTGLTRTTNTITVNTSQNIATLSNLTTNGFVKTGGAVGTLSVDTATYQASAATLTSWAAITRASGFDTFVATPSSANLRGVLTDENGTGAALFSGATTPDFTTGFTIGAAAASGKIPIGNGTNYVPSTPTWPNSAVQAGKVVAADGTNFVTSTAGFPTTAAPNGAMIQGGGSNWAASVSTWPTTAVGSLQKVVGSDGTNFALSGPTLPIAVSSASGKIIQSDGTNWIASTPTWPTAAGTAGYTLRSDGTNIASYPQDMLNSSVASQSPSTSDVYLTGSNVVVAAGDFRAKGQYHCIFDVTKTAGTGAIVISVRIGTAGTTADTAQQTFTFGSGTSVADVGIFEVFVNWRTVGASATVQGICRAEHNLATTGLFNNAAAWTIVPSTSVAFSSASATNIGVSFNGGTSFAGTISTVQATLLQ